MRAHKENSTHCSLDNSKNYALKKSVTLYGIKIRFMVLNTLLLFYLCFSAHNIGLLWYPFTGVFVRTILLNQKHIFYYSLVFFPILLIILFQFFSYYALCFIMVLGNKYRQVDSLLLLISFLIYFIFVSMDEKHLYTFSTGFLAYNTYKFFLFHIADNILNIELKHPFSIYLIYVSYFLLVFIEYTIRRVL